MTDRKLTDDFPLLQFDCPWMIRTFEGNDDLDRRITFDEQLLQQIIRGECGPCVCVKRERRCLVTSVRESRMPGFDDACRALAEQGWPVVVRCTGGSCVPQGTGVISLSVVHRKLRGWRLEDGFRLLCEFLTRFLADYGLPATVGEVPESFCDGKYNLQIAGRKLAGTAQRWAGGSREQAAVLAHACLLVDLDLVEATEKVNTLYRLCGNARQFRPDACTTLRNCLGGISDEALEAFVAEVEQRLKALARDYFDIP